MIKDILHDLTQHTHGLGVIDLVKVVGTATETQIFAVTDDKALIVYGTLKHPLADFIGTFGMPNLAKLKTILSLPVFDDTSVIKVTHGKRDDPAALDSIHFETKVLDFITDYRLMAQSAIEDKVKNVTFKGTTWNVEFEPTVLGIQRLKMQASANSEESHFTTKIEKGELKVYFGDPSTHSGNFVFQSGITGNLAKTWAWPVKIFLSIMDLPGDKHISFADAGVAEITVDSGLAVWRYLLPAYK